MYRWTFLGLACLLVASFGCIAFHEPLAAPSAAVDVPGLPAIHIRVRRPRIEDPIPIPDSVPDWWEHDYRDLTLPYRIQEAERVRAILAATGLFASVESEAPDRADDALAIRPMLPPPYGTCEGQGKMLIMLSLGIFPYTCDRDRGVYFHVESRGDALFACSWPQTELIGWLPVALATGLGSWTREPDDAAFLQRLRGCIRDQLDLFEAVPPTA